jgi:hypothetical protein
VTPPSPPAAAGTRVAEAAARTSRVARALGELDRGLEHVRRVLAPVRPFRLRGVSAPVTLGRLCTPRTPRGGDVGALDRRNAAFARKLEAASARPQWLGDPERFAYMAELAALLGSDGEAPRDGR